ncbi:MAG: DUF2461 domain-containing protein, partial [Gemmataceae bacterium]|nr:DUF2461 domain-containing protein [Gemmataceae bacterium]
MPAPRRDALPLAPLLHAYVSPGVPSLSRLHDLPGLGKRVAAVLGASARFLYSDFLDSAPPAKLLDALLRFHDEVVPLPLHAPTLQARAGFLRHAVSFLLRGEGTPSAKLAAVLDPAGPYRVPGLGPAFWSAVLQGSNPARFPGWTPLAWAGLVRLGFASGGSNAERYSSLLGAHARIRRIAPALTSLHIDHFLSLVGAMEGRSLPDASALERDPFVAAIAGVRHGDGLRRTLKERGQQLAQAQSLLEAALDAADGKRLGDALALADPDSAARSPLDWSHPALVGHARALFADDAEAALEAFHRAALAGAWLPAAVLHLRDPMRWLPYGDRMRQAHALLDDGTGPDDPPAIRYRLFAEACAALREKHALHPLELPFVLGRLLAPPDGPAEFAGFCDDTFRFLGELHECNSRSWMDAQRGRYRFAVREPLVELCKALAERYVEPHLRGLHGWPLDTSATPGHALTSIVKNSFGRGGPYSSALWITFCRTGRKGAQLFVRLDPSGVRFGLRVGPRCPDLARLRAALSTHAEETWRLLQARGADAHCHFGQADRPATLKPLSSSHDMLEWASLRGVEASAAAPAGAALLDEVVAAFDRLLPLAGLCHEEDGAAFLRRLGGSAGSGYGA